MRHHIPTHKFVSRYYCQVCKGVMKKVIPQVLVSSITVKCWHLLLVKQCTLLGNTFLTHQTWRDGVSIRFSPWNRWFTEWYEHITDLVYYVIISKLELLWISCFFKKAGEYSGPSIYYPVRLLPLIGKVFVALITVELVKYLICTHTEVNTKRRHCALCFNTIFRPEINCHLVASDTEIYNANWNIFFLKCFIDNGYKYL